MEQGELPPAGAESVWTEHRDSLTKKLWCKRQINISRVDFDFINDIVVHVLQRYGYSGFVQLHHQNVSVSKSNK